MSKFFFIFFAGFIVFLSLYNSLKAEEGILVVHVSDVKNRPISGVVLSTKGDGSGGAETDVSGKARLLLARENRPGDWVSLQIVRVRDGKDWVFISPWDKRAVIPPFQNKSDNFVPVIFAERGDKVLLENENALLAIVEKFNIANVPKLVNQQASEMDREKILAEIARDYGLSSEELDEAIRSWSKTVKEPYKKGLANLYSENYSESTDALIESLKLQKTNPEHSKEERLSANLFLGLSLYEQGKYDEAIIAYREALASDEDDIVLLNGLGNALFTIGNYTEAERFFSKAVKISEIQPDKDNPYIIMSLLNFAKILEVQRKYEEAERLSRQVLKISKKRFGREHYLVGLSLNNLGTLLIQQRKYAEAEQLLREALPILEKEFGKKQFLAVACLSNLGMSLTYQGKQEEAEELHRQVLKISKKHFGKQNLLVAVSLSGIGISLIQKGKFKEAETLFREALPIFEKVYGKDHFYTIDCLANLGLSFVRQGKFVQAELLYEQVLKTAETQLGQDNPRIAGYLILWGFALLEKGKYDEAESFNRRALKILEASSWVDYLQMATCLNNLGLALHYQSKHTEAEVLYRQALQNIANLGIDHPQIGITLMNLALAKYEQNKYREAESLLLEALPILEKGLGNNHPNTKLARDVLDELR